MVSTIIGQDAGAKGHQAKGHGVTGQNLEMKVQEVKGKISVMKRRGLVQNNKHGLKLTFQKWKVRKSKVGQVKDYGVIIVVVSQVTDRRSVGWKASGVKVRSGQLLWCNYGRSVKGHGSEVGRVKDQSSWRSVRSNILVS